MSEENLCKLTCKEIEVLSLVAKGYKNKRIADELKIGVRTVESHVAKACQKLGATGRANAVMLAMQKGLLR